MKIITIPLTIINYSIEFEIPVFDNSEVSINKFLVGVKIEYREKGLVYTESPRPVSVTSVELMGAIPKLAKIYNENKHGFQFAPWKEYESDDSLDVTIRGPSNGGYTIIIPENLPFDREIIYEMITSSIRNKI